MGQSRRVRASPRRVRWGRSPARGSQPLRPARFPWASRCVDRKGQAPQFLQEKFAWPLLHSFAALRRRPRERRIQNPNPTVPAITSGNRITHQMHSAQLTDSNISGRKNPPMPPRSGISSIRSCADRPALKPIGFGAESGVEINLASPGTARLHMILSACGIGSDRPLGTQVTTILAFAGSSVSNALVTGIAIMRVCRAGSELPSDRTPTLNHSVKLLKRRELKFALSLRAAIFCPRPFNMSI